MKAGDWDDLKKAVVALRESQLLEAFTQGEITHEQRRLAWPGS